MAWNPSVLMACTEEQGFLASRNLSSHGAHHPDACADDRDYPEDPGDGRKRTEVAELLHQPAPMSTSDSDPCEIARRALDLMFPREEDSDDGWSTWSAREEGSDYDDDVDDGQAGEGVDDCSDYEEEEEEEEEKDGNGQVILAETNCPGSPPPPPPYPMNVLPDATGVCILGAKSCYHRVYKTHDTSTTPSTLGKRTPSNMLQIFSIRLSSFEPSYPISLYGIFAVRDYLDPRRNYVFNCPRDDAVTIDKQDFFVIPLCSPCRGMYILDQALVEVDLWVKKEGDESDDKQLLSAYADIDIRNETDMMFYERISGDNCNLDLKYSVLSKSVEAVIQVYAKVDHPRHARFTAFSTGYDDYPHRGVVLFDDKLFGKEKLFQHIVAVKENEELDVILEVGGSMFKWTFQDERIGAVVSPDDSILDYGQFFVRVLFAPKDFQGSLARSF
uniref:DUF6598 domain-containing protein n=1 Tax=Hordeum vulgare subsp. vulgare TaxID=112509 RepID=A0A8I6WEG6_HORVV